MHTTLIDKINFAEHKEKTEDILDMLLCNVKEQDPKLYKHIEGEMYEMAYGKTISDEMAEKWVKSLNPMGKWTKEEVANVISSYGIDIPINCAYPIINTRYSDSSDVLGDGNTEESLMQYIKETKNFYFDKDYEGTGTEKTFDYGKYILKVI